MPTSKRQKAEVETARRRLIKDAFDCLTQEGVTVTVTDLAKATGLSHTTVRSYLRSCPWWTEELSAARRPEAQRRAAQAMKAKNVPGWAKSWPVSLARRYGSSLADPAAHLAADAADERDNAICRAYQAGVPLKEITQQFGVSESHVYYTLRRLNVPIMRRKQARSPARLTQLYQEGQTLRTLANRWKVTSQQVIRDLLLQAGVTLRPEDVIPSIQETCVACGKQLTARQRYDRQRFCSRICAGRSQAKGPIQETCVACGKQLTARQRRDRQRFCSYRCSNGARHGSA